MTKAIIKNTFDPYTWHENLSFRWIALPVLAHLFSWMTGVGGILLFPVLITIAQYLILKIHPAVVKPGIWFITLPLTLFIWVKWGPYISTNRTGDAVLNGVNAYYVGQLVNALCIPLIIRKEKPVFLLNWLLSTAIAWVAWIILYKLLVTGQSVDKPGNTSSFTLKVYLIYPIIALIANAISSLVLTNNRLLIKNETE
ncbi:hypothetical protein [Spirosoma spitsbergense]|uniref:hypothetical protein n=1 Tax=Spirosoma spitsbergense TaxID=431554 RepID=UPI00035D5E24|nr:hypothetical protein [Spirosoma spitsbergense]